MNEKEVLEQIESRFKELYYNNKDIKGFEYQLLQGTISDADCVEYGRRIGDTLKQAWAENVYEEMLDNGILYEEQALALLNPNIQRNYQLCTDFYTKAQKKQYQKLGLGLNPVVPQYDMSMTQGLATYIAGLPYNEREMMFLDSLVTNAIKNIDKGIQKNAEFMSRTGMDVKVRRRLSGVGKAKGGGRIPCKLCEQFKGEEYEVGEEPRYFYSRHQGCRCIIEKVMDGKPLR